jgi:hypothetical protein
MDGKCEVNPEMDCVWAKAVLRAPRTAYADEIGRINPPVDWQLHKTASWVTFAVGRDQVTSGSDKGPFHASEVISS